MRSSLINKFVLLLLTVWLCPLQSFAEETVPYIYGITVVGDLNNYKATMAEQDLRAALKLLEKSDALGPALVIQGYNFTRKEDLKILKKLKVERSHLPRLLLVELKGSVASPTRTLWGKPVVDIRKDLNGLMAYLELAPLPEDFALSQFEAVTFDAQRVATEQKRQAAEVLRQRLGECEREVKSNLRSARKALTPAEKSSNPDRYYSSDFERDYPNDPNGHRKNLLTYVTSGGIPGCEITRYLQYSRGYIAEMRLVLESNPQSSVTDFQETVRDLTHEYRNLLSDYRVWVQKWNALFRRFGLPEREVRLPEGLDL